MSKKIFLTAAFIFVFAALANAQTKPEPAKTSPLPAAATTAASKAPRNVVDYFLLLPNKYALNMTRAKREKALKAEGATTDTSNGYLEIVSQTGDTANIYVGIFKKDGGGYLVTTATGTYGKNKLFTYRFLEYDGKNFTDVSKKVLPADFKLADYYNGESNEYPCELPRFNRTFTCRKPADGEMVYLGWTGKDFVIE